VITKSKYRQQTRGQSLGLQFRHSRNRPNIGNTITSKQQRHSEFGSTLTLQCCKIYYILHDLTFTYYKNIQDL